MKGSRPLEFLKVAPFAGVATECKDTVREDLQRARSFPGFLHGQDEAVSSSDLDLVDQLLAPLQDASVPPLSPQEALQAGATTCSHSTGSGSSEAAAPGNMQGRNAAHIPNSRERRTAQARAVQLMEEMQGFGSIEGAACLLFRNRNHSKQTIILLWHQYPCELMCHVLLCQSLNEPESDRLLHCAG